MYSFESCGVGVAEGIASGFHELAAFFGNSLPNQPIRLPDNGSVFGSQPFLANTPRPIINTHANMLKEMRSRFRFDGSRVGIRDMGILLRNQIVKKERE